MLRQRRFTLILVSVILLAEATASLAQPTEPAEVLLKVHSELQMLNSNIERIAALLASNLEGQRLDLLIKRVELGSGRLAHTEQNLRGAKATQSSLADEKLEIEARLTQLADELDSGVLDWSTAEVERYTNDLALRLELLKGKLRDVARDVLELENEVMSRRSEIQDWQDYFDRELSSP